MNIEQLWESQSPKERTEFAKRADIPRDFYYQLARGIRQPGTSVRAKLKLASEGRLTDVEMRPDIFAEFTVPA